MNTSQDGAAKGILVESGIYTYSSTHFCTDAGSITLFLGSTDTPSSFVLVLPMWNGPFTGGVLVWMFFLFIRNALLLFQWEPVEFLVFAFWRFGTVYACVHASCFLVPLFGSGGGKGRGNVGTGRWYHIKSLSLP